MSASSSQFSNRIFGNRNPKSCLQRWGQAIFALPQLAICLLIGAVDRGAAESPPPPLPAKLSSAADVIRLSHEVAKTRLPITITGVVTFASEDLGLFFIQDGTGGIFVDTGTWNPVAEPGRMISMTGRTQRGRFKPIATMESYKDLGPAEFPESNPRTLRELWTGTYDCDWVSIRAYVRTHTTDSGATMLKLGDATSSVRATVLHLPTNWLPDLDFSEVELSGVSSVAVDDEAKIQGISVWVPGTNQIRILRTGREVVSTLPELSLSKLSRQDDSFNFGQPIKITGTVAHTSRRFGIKLHDGEAGITIANFESPAPAIGRKVEAIGWLQRVEDRIQISGASLRDLGQGTLPSPKAITISEAHSRELDGVTVTMEGALRHRVVADGDDIWILERNGEFFEASLPPGMEDLKNPMVAPGTTVRLTGVLMLGDPSAGKPVEPCILLRTTADVEILSPAPWPMRRVLWTISILLGLNVVALIALGVVFVRQRRQRADLDSARMALQAVNQDLEKRVESRTKTLSVAHEALRDSEERFRQLAEHIDQIFWMSSADNKQILYLSPGFESICGYPVETVYNRPESWSEIIHPDDRERVLKTVLSQPVTEDYEIDYRVVRPDGSLRWIRDRAFPVRDDSGKVYRVAGIAEDITARRQSEEELREQHIALTNAMPGISRVDAAGNYTYVNSHYAKMLGYTPEELAGMPFSHSVHPEDMLAAMRTYEQMKISGKSETELRGIRKDKSIFWKQVLLVRIAPENGAHSGHHCFMRDITSRKLNELLLEGQKAVLETIASGAPTGESFSTIVRFIETLAPGTLASLMVVSPDGRSLKVGAAPSLPERFVTAITDIPICESSGPCGAAAHSRQRVALADIAGSNSARSYLDAARAAGLQACASTPIFSSEGAVLGTLAIYFNSTRGPTSEEEHLTHVATQLAAIVIEQDRIQRAEQETRDRYGHIVNSAIDAVITLDEDLRVQVFNPAAERMFGCTQQQALHQPLETFVPDRHRSLLLEYLSRSGQADSTLGATVPISGRRANSEEFPIEASVSQTRLHGRKIYTAILRDLTEKQKSEKTRSQLESRLRQSQKMEAIGTLAGGIAHDFNNILGAVMLNIELAKGELQTDHPAQEYLLALKTSSIRARDLVRQILAFSRQQEQQRTILRLERIVAEALKLVRAALPPNIVINLHLCSDGPSIIADPTQLHQVLTNLCTNAAHAMRERGGQLEIRQQFVTVTEQLAAESPDLQPGNYVELVVSDTGTGMTPEVLERIFDPFFTTKALGEGTGLGLAVVHGIMKDHDGAIVVESTPGKGTRFHLYFPAVDLPESTANDPNHPIPRGQGQRVLVVDDEDALLKVNQRTLERLGYSVTAFTSPTVALEAFRTNSALFDLVITDLAMPGMSGVDLSRELKNFRPDCPIIITTGYTASLDTQNVKSLGLAGIIFKPATPVTIGEMVHRALNTHRPGSMP